MENVVQIVSKPFSQDLYKLQFPGQSNWRTRAGQYGVLLKRIPIAIILDKILRYDLAFTNTIPHLHLDQMHIIDTMGVYLFDYVSFS